MAKEDLTQAFLGFKNALIRLVQRFVDNPVDVEDIVHEAYVRSLAASQHKEIDAPKAYMARTARNLALNFIANANTAHTENLADDDEVIDDRLGANSIEEQVEVDRQFHDYCAAVERLPVQCRRVFTLRQVYGLTQKEIARCLGISEKTVEYHVSRGLLQCRRSLRARYDVGVRSTDVITIKRGTGDE